MERVTKEVGKLYQDQLYGTKVLTPLAVAIVDTPEFQRLAGLKQLGFSDLVYRGAVHSRLSHCIGTYLLARTIMRRIVQNHERLALKHPGEGLPKCFRVLPQNWFPESGQQEDQQSYTSSQSLWRGLTEVVSAAALLHDVGHVPFGHTLEDEFAGIYKRHDRLAGPRLYDLLHHEDSQLRAVFSSHVERWIKEIKNEDLGKLIYVILSWKEDIDPPADFQTILQNTLDKLQGTASFGEKARTRLETLKSWHDDFASKGMFHPFMSDIIGNTICADLLDYLPRDRMNLGMEWRRHERLQRYLTIRKGSLYPNEGLRVSIMVTRVGHGGQRRDVATAVLDIMRERYEMAERVYYHHKKAAASAMLAKLTELVPTANSEELDDIYPAPWTKDGQGIVPRHPVHFSDASFVDHLGTALVAKPSLSELQKDLYLGLRYDRRAIYRTLMVVDTDVVRFSSRTISYFAVDLRGNVDSPSNKGRLDLESKLAIAAAKAVNLDEGDSFEGEVLVYCPSPDMQSKEVNARMEIIENRVLPLSVQKESFAYHADVRVLQQYYEDLWRIYVFVSPRVYDNKAACQAVVDAFCSQYRIDPIVAYSKVRRHDFKIKDIIAREVFEPVRKFIDKQSADSEPFDFDIPTPIVVALLGKAENDPTYMSCIRNRTGASERVSTLFNVVVLETRLVKLTGASKRKAREYIQRLESGQITRQLVARGDQFPTFEAYSDDLLDVAIGQDA